MSTTPEAVADNTLDADQIIQNSLNLENPTSFFLYAGAGSGKTHSLVLAVRAFKERERERLMFEGRQVAIITYTNAACDEISRRLEHDPLVSVSTIHAFSWRMIQGFNDDIRNWLRTKLTLDIATLEDKIRRARSENKTKKANRAELERKSRRLTELDEVETFTYSPTGENRGRQALNHSEVIQMAAEFIQRPPLLDVMVDLHPVLLIDESQDTNRALMNAFLEAQQSRPSRFCLGLLGDTMQRIYPDGKENLDKAIPAHWAKPEKRINRRCPKRVVELINSIRASTDDHQQVPKENAIQGTVRMFCVQQTAAQNFDLEEELALRMNAITGDEEWANSYHGRKTLILEHKMAARRMGFEHVFTPLHAVEHLRTGLLDGSLPVLKLFLDGVMPILEAARKDEFSLMEEIRLRSPLLDQTSMKESADQLALLDQAGNATQQLLGLFEDNDPLLSDVVQVLTETKLLEVPDRLLAAQILGIATHEPPDTDDRGALETHAYQTVLGRHFSEMAAFAGYSQGLSPFDTHQGVKGLEFPRVMVILNDEEAGGFLFSYEKLLGVKPPSDSDIRNEREGNDSSLARTRRLLYVTCSRAEQSLAIVVYTPQPEVARQRVIEAGWLHADEIETL